MNQIRLATPADAESIRAIYAPYVVQTTFTFEYEIPTREEFLRRMEKLSVYPWLVYELVQPLTSSELHPYNVLNLLKVFQNSY